MKTTDNNPIRLRIGDLELDTGTATVRRSGSVIELPKLSFDLLLCLARHAPNLVDTDTLMSEVWGKVVVGEETVKQRVKLLRQALADPSAEPKYVLSVRGRGYRIKATVSAIEEPVSFFQARIHWFAPLGALLLMAIAGGFWLWQQTFQEDPQNGQSEVTNTARRIAVLPFKFFSGQESDEYLADGITEDMLTALTRIEGLGVIARTTMMRYKATSLGVADIARELKVGTVLEGSIQRHGENLRVTVQMIDAANEEHYWAHTYETTLADLPKVQIEFAERVAASLNSTLSRIGAEYLQRGSTEVSAAYDAYLRGRAHYRHWNPQDNEMAIGFYQQAIEEDPAFALAIAGLANAFALRSSRFGGDARWIAEAAKQAELALSLSPDLPEAHKALGLVSFYSGHYKKSLEYYLQAVAQNPEYDEAIFNIAEIYHLQGRWDMAVQFQLRDSERASGAITLAVYLRGQLFIDEADELLALSVRDVPVSFVNEASLSLQYLLSGEFSKARTHAERLRVSFPNNYLGWQRSGEIELHAGNFEAAEEYIREAVDRAGNFQLYPQLRLAELLKLRGEDEAALVLFNEAEEIILSIIEAGHEAWYHRWNLAFLYALRGENQKAVDWFAQSVNAGRRRFEWDEKESAFTRLHDNPAFMAAINEQRDERMQMRSRVAELLRTNR